jgi:HEAT repeat protein
VNRGALKKKFPSADRFGAPFPEFPMRSPRFLAALPLILGIWCLGCQTTVNGRPVTPRGSGEFEELSPFVKEDIEQKLKNVPYLRGQQVVEASSEIVKAGPGAIPLLQDAAADDDEMRRSFAMNVMGSIGDRRALPTLRRGTQDSVPAVRYEAARACAHLGDWTSGMPVLIGGLDDQSVYFRALCNEALRRQTKLDFGFQAKGDPDDRKKAASRWRDWWDRHERATLGLR